jgi:hypothetical protein
LEAFKEALRSTDTLIGRDLRLWAIEELGKLGSAEAIGVLIDYAMELQTAYYDEAGISLPIVKTENCRI